MMKWTLRCLLLLLWMLPALAAELQGIRWFEHDDHTRVVFDLDARVAYQVERVSAREVEVLLDGSVTHRTGDRLRIGSGVVVRAEAGGRRGGQTLWTLTCTGVGKVRHFGLDESPFRIVIDVYPGEGVSSRETSPGEGNTQAAAHRDTQMQTQHAVSQQTPQATQRPAAHTGEPEPGSIDDPENYQGLSTREYKRLRVGELLLELGDYPAALQQLKKLSERSTEHPMVRYRMGQVYYNLGDLFRAKQQLEPLLEIPVYAEAARLVVLQLDGQEVNGVLPGGEIRQDDLAYYLEVLRQGKPLSASDLYHSPVVVRKSSRFLPGLMLGIALGLAVFLIIQAIVSHRRKAAERKRIISDALGDSTPEVPEELNDYSSVSRRVQDELEQELAELSRSQEEAPQTPVAPPRQAAAAEPAPAAIPDPEPEVTPELTQDDDISMGSGSREEAVYRLADQKKSIVEIAESLDMGVDEVRLILELRED